MSFDARHGTIVSFRSSARIQPAPVSRREENQQLSGLNHRMVEVAKNQKREKESSGWFDCFSCSSKQPPASVEALAPLPRKYLAAPPQIFLQNEERKIEEKPKVEEQLPDALIPAKPLVNGRKVRFSSRVDIKEIQPINQKKRKKKVELLWAADILDARFGDQIQSETGMKLKMVQDGALFFDLLQKRSRVKLIVIDFDASAIDGLELVRAIRKQGLRLPILGISVESSRPKRRAYKEAGVTDFMQKPLTTELLSARIHSLVHGQGCSVSSQKVMTANIR